MKICNYKYLDRDIMSIEVEKANIINYELEIINNNEETFLLPMKEIKINDGIKFEVDITKKTSIATYVSNKKITFNLFMTILNRLCHIKMTCQEYLLNPNNIIFNNNTIFIDENNEIYVLYLPVEKSLVDKNIDWFKKYIIELSSLVEDNNSSNLSKIINVLNNSNTTIKDLKRLIEEILEKEKNENIIVKSSKEHELNEQKKASLWMKIKELFSKKQKKDSEMNNKEKLNNEKINVRAYLIFNNETNSQEIEINKDVFLIGRMADAVDYVISNNAVGRVHARIEKINNDYYITDLASKNGSYINGARLVANEKYKLENKNIIRLANIEMSFNK